MISTILVPLIVLGVLIVVHEFGHFIAAKWCKVSVIRFAVGFGPALFKKRVGETLYQVCAIPLGGYVRMMGDIPDMITGRQESDGAVRALEDLNEEELQQQYGLSDEDQKLISDRSSWFLEKPLLQRSFIVAAGPIANFLLAWLLVTVCVLCYGKEDISEEPIIGKIAQGSPAQQAGITPGDRVLNINGVDIQNWEKLAKTIRNGTGEELTLKVERSGELTNIFVTPESQEDRMLTGETRKVFMIGIGPEISVRDAGFIESAQLGALWTTRASVGTLMGLWGLVSGYVSPKELAGPLFILGEANRQADKGLEDLLMFMALISVSLAVLNLLPIPILDGGHLLFFMVEGIFGAISVKKREMAQQVGMVFLLSLMGFAIYNDIFRDPTDFNGDIKWKSSQEKIAPEKKSAK